MSGRGCDLVVVGGGPAGLAVAIRARQAGLSVVVLEARTPPVDQACGEALMPDGAALLEEMGVKPAVSVPFGGIRYLDGEVTAAGRFSGRAGLGVRRVVLHRALSERASRLGADLRWGVRVSGLAEDGVEVGSEVVRAAWVVAADGRHSRLRAWAGLAPEPPPGQRFGVRRHYRIAPWTDMVEVYWEQGCEAYVTPVAPDQVGVAMIWSGRGAGFDQLIARVPALHARLDGAAAASRDAGAGPFGSRASAVARGRVALVGDAATVMVASVALGIAVDNTAHLLERVRHNRASGAAMRDVVATALRQVDPAMVVTTTTAVVGFLSLAFSSFVPIRDFGLLAAAAMVVALAGDALLVPAMLVLTEWR